MTANPPNAARLAPAALRRLLRHREVGAALLSGDGLEIGALHYPLTMDGTARCAYLDVEDTASLRARFPELAEDTLVEPQWIGDIVRETVPAITGRRFDFIILNHVLEHVANPIQAIANVWQGLVDGGYLVLSVPDKAFTFDRTRPLTSYEHFWFEFAEGVRTVSSDHYVDLLAATSPEVLDDPARYRAALERAAARREHAHVWDSGSFRDFWRRSARHLGLGAELLYESTAAANQFEYFAVFARLPRTDRPARAQPLRVLAALYRARDDLRAALPAADPRLAARLLTWATTAGAGIDAAAPALRAFQPQYRLLLAGVRSDGASVEAELRGLLRP